MRSPDRRSANRNSSTASAVAPYCSAARIHGLAANPLSKMPIARLRQEIAPLMQWRNIRGFGDALALDLLIARMQIAVLRGSGGISDLKIELLGRPRTYEVNTEQVMKYNVG